MTFPYSFFSPHKDVVRKNIRSWSEDSLCLTQKMNVELFYDPEDSNLKKLSASVCANCPVQKHCLYTSIILDEDYGLWGGFTPKQRRIFLKRLYSIARNKNIDLSSWNKDIADFIFTNCSYNEAFDILD